MVTPKAINPKCDFCDKEAIYDGKTKLGPWAYMCEEHKNVMGVTGKAAELYIRRLKTAEPKRRCTICGEEKPQSLFYQYTDHNGVTRYRPECKVCNLQRRRAVSSK